MGPTRLRLSKPTLAAIEGYAVAGGLELALWADMRIVAEDATFGVFCRRWGVPLVDGGTVRLPRLIGHSRAMDMILTGRPVLAPEALDIGLANRLVPPGTSLQAAQQLAETIANFPQACMRADRTSALQQWDCDRSGDDNEGIALKNEYECGKRVLMEAVSGAAVFASGEGRGGSFEAFKPRNPSS
jgi:enoyl-CoA hydratase